MPPTNNIPDPFPLNPDGTATIATNTTIAGTINTSTGNPRKTILSWDMVWKVIGIIFTATIAITFGIVLAQGYMGTFVPFMGDTRDRVGKLEGRLNNTDIGNLQGRVDELSKTTDRLEQRVDNIQSK